MPVRIIEIYWSPVVRLKKRPDATVELTTPIVRCATRRKRREIASNIPLPHMTPPKHMAQIMSQMVSIIPPMPLVATRSLSRGLPVSTAVEVVMARMMALSDEKKSSDSAPTMRIRISGCAIAIAMAAMKTDEKRVTIAGKRRLISTPVNTGTKSNQGEMLYVACRAVSICMVSAADAGEVSTPDMVNTIRAIMIDGIVVIIMYLI